MSRVLQAPPIVGLEPHSVATTGVMTEREISAPNRTPLSEPKNPLDRDLVPGQRLRNETYFANIIWDVTEAFRVGGEVTYRKASYTVLRHNDGVGFQMQVQ
jgi:hypothetical protein